VKVLLSCGLIVVLVWYAVVGPMREEIHALEAHISAGNPEIQRARAFAVALPALEREIRELETALEAFENAGKGGQTADSLIADLQAAAADAQVRITGLKPRTDLVPAGRAERTIELTIEGTYHGVGRLLGRLSSSARVVNTPEVGLRVRAGGRGENANVAGSIILVDAGLSPSGPSPDGSVGYDAGGRRDPFENPFRPKPSPSPTAAGSRGRGLASVPLADVVVRGIARNREQRLAILETSGRQSFIVRSLDQLSDSIVVDIDSSGVVFVRRDGRDGPVHVHKPIRPVIGERP
jgi:Tfp pilus assembly protein PilO